MFPHRLVGIPNEAFWADKGEEAGTYHGFKDRGDEECEDVEDDRLRRLALRRARSRGGASNKYTFRKVSQIVFSQGYKFKMHVFLQASANMLSQKLGNK